MLAAWHASNESLLPLVLAWSVTWTTTQSCSVTLSFVCDANLRVEPTIKDASACDL